MEYLKVSISKPAQKPGATAGYVHALSFHPHQQHGIISKADEEFLKKLNNLIQTNMQNPEFSLIDMADQLCMSRSSLNRKTRGFSDLTPNDYLRIERLKKAAQLLKEGNCKINEVCYMVGFNTPSYFCEMFPETIRGTAQRIHHDITRPATKEPQNRTILPSCPGNGVFERFVPYFARIVVACNAYLP